MFELNFCSNTKYQFHTWFQLISQLILWYSIKVQNLEWTYKYYLSFHAAKYLWKIVSECIIIIDSFVQHIWQIPHSTFILDASWILSALAYTKMLKVDVVASTWRLARFVSKWTQFHVSICQVVLTNVLMTYVTGHTFFQLKVEFTVHIFTLGI